MNDTFELYDLEIVVERIDGHCTCRMSVGDKVLLKSGKVSLPAGAALPLRAAGGDPLLRRSSAGARRLDGTDTP